jgi:hypothetical protein
MLTFNVVAAVSHSKLWYASLELFWRRMLEVRCYTCMNRVQNATSAGPTCNYLKRIPDVGWLPGNEISCPAESFPYFRMPYIIPHPI